MLAKVLISPPIEQFFGMADIEGIGYLSAGYGKGAVGRAFATEFYDCLFALHDAFENARTSARPSSLSFASRAPPISGTSSFLTRFFVAPGARPWS